MNYLKTYPQPHLNKALDTFNTAMVSSVYYIFFTICTITASSIMYKDLG